jgi:hypothetical protein
MQSWIVQEHYAAVGDFCHIGYRRNVDMAEVQDFATKWMWSYNHDRPNMALGGFTPKQRLAMAA